MLNSIDFYKAFGFPTNTSKLTVWDVPDEIELGFIPKKIYCHVQLIEPLTLAFTNLITSGCVSELKTWDGCYNFRAIRGYEDEYEAAIDNGKILQAVKYLSVHSWGCAIDVNAFENGLGKKPKLSPEFVACFKDAGFDWGGDFTRLDGMHFQLSMI